MLNIEDKLKGKIIDFTHEGSGVLKVDNFTVFVPQGVIGDELEIKITEVKKNYAIGTITKLINPSPDRVTGKINIGNYSGEMPFIDYKYEKQLEWKKNKVKMDLVKFADITDDVVQDTIGMDNPYRYRNHTQIPVGSRNGRAVLGFYEKSSHDIVDMDGSILQPEFADRIIQSIRNWINKYDIKPYVRRTNTGVLKHIGVRTNKDNQAMVILVTATNYLPKSNELVELLTKENLNIVSIYHNINNLKSAPTYGNKYKKVYGEDSLVDYLGDFKFNISPRSFFQVNRIQAETIYNKAIEYLDIQKDDIVLDIYSGIGSLSLYIAKEAKKVYGIELIKDAVLDAEENAKINNVSNVEFLVGKAEEIFPSLMEKGITGNKVVIDPPRKGCEKEVLEAIVELNPEKIVYVSCNSTTMARDVKYLVESGYNVVKVQPADMFPQTAHVESIILMTYCGSREK